MNDVGPMVIACKALVMMVLFFVLYRAFGKRAVSQMNLYDLVTIVALSNAVQNAITVGQGQIWVGLVGASTIILTSWLVGRMFLFKPSLERQVLGVPTVLVHNGHVSVHTLRKQHVTLDELKEAMRDHGLVDFDKVRLAVLEIDGSISVI